nr:paired amphipathic helix protein Sin3-like 2 isoform X1 [Ipomoea batatas]
MVLGRTKEELHFIHLAHAAKAAVDFVAAEAGWLRIAAVLPPSFGRRWSDWFAAEAGPTGSATNPSFSRQSFHHFDDRSSAMPTLRPLHMDKGEGSLNRDSACCSVSTDIRGSPFLRHLLVTEKEMGKDGDRSCYVLAGCSTLPPTHSTYCKLGDKRERCCRRAIRFVDAVAVYQRRMYRRNRPLLYFCLTEGRSPPPSIAGRNSPAIALHRRYSTRAAV